MGNRDARPLGVSKCRKHTSFIGVETDRSSAGSGVARPRSACPMRDEPGRVSGSSEDDPATRHPTAADPGRGPRLHGRQRFMAGSTPVDFRFVERADVHAFVRRFLVRSRYLRLRRSDTGLARRFLIREVTGFSRARTARLITRYRETGRIEDGGGVRSVRSAVAARRRTSVCWPGVAESLSGPCGPGGPCGAVTRRATQRQYEVHGDARFRRLAGNFPQPSVPSSPVRDVTAAVVRRW